MLDVSKAMISLKSTYKMKPQKLYFNDVKCIFWRIKGMTSACNAAWVCGTWVSVDATEELQTCFIAQVWEQLSLVWPLGIVCGHNSTKCAQKYFIYESQDPQMTPDLEKVKGSKF